MTKAGKRRRGRPPKAPEDRKRNNLTMRLRDRTKGDLEKSARQNQRSLSEEAEARIEQSFRDQRQLPAALEATYGMVIAGIVQVVAAAMSDAAKAASFEGLRTLDDLERWHANPYRYDQVAKAALIVVERYRPKGEIVAPNNVTAPLAGIGCANRRLGVFAGSVGSPELFRWAESIREQLAPLGERLKRAPTRLPDWLGEAKREGPGMDIGKPIKRHYVVPLKEAVQDTNEPPSPAPASNKQKV